MATRRHSEQIDINVKVNSSNAAEQIRQISRSVFEAKTLLNQPIRAKLNFSDMSNGAKQANGFFRQMAGSIRTIHTLVAGLAFNSVIGFVVRSTDTLTNLENKVKAVSNANENLEFTMTRLNHIANSTRTSIASVATVYSRTARATTDLGTSQATTLEFTKALAQAVTVGGSTAVEAEQAMIQLSQGMSSGTLKGDELRSVLEQLPIVAQAIAKEMGVAVGQLKDLGAQGKIQTDVVLSALINSLDDTDKTMANLTLTFEQSSEILHNKWIAGLKMFQPLIQGLGESLGWVTEKWEMMGDAMTHAFTGMIKGREGAVNLTMRAQGDIAVMEHLKGMGFKKSELKDAAAGITPQDREDILKAAGFGQSTAQSPWEYAEQQRKLREEEAADEDLIQRGTALADIYDLGRKQAKKPPPKKGAKEGGLTFAEMMEKMRQEQEVARQSPFESGVTKEFFQKMGMLKDSVREGLVSGAGKGGSADAQLQQLVEMIRLEHELAEVKKLNASIEETLLKIREEHDKKSAEASKNKMEALARERMALEQTDRATMASLDPLHDYNEELARMTDFMARHPDQVEAATAHLGKMSTAYQTFTPIVDDLKNSIADAAAQALVFGENLSQALDTISKQIAAQFVSKAIGFGLDALFGVPQVPGAPTTVPTGATGGYFPGYAYGGYTGSDGRGQVAGVVHGQEFVVNANATARNRALLESVNSGKTVSSNVTVHNYAGVHVESQSSSNGDIELIIRKAIAEQAPGVIAGDLQNKNSRTSKAMRSNFKIPGRI